MEQENRIVFLACSKIVLRHLMRADIKKLLVWFNDQEVTQYVSKYLPIYEAEEEEWLNNIAKRKDTDIVLAIETQEGEFIGTIGLHGISYKNRVATLGIAIGEKKCWSQGYGSMAISALVKYSFNTLNMRKVCLSVFGFNARAKACYLKCGFKEEGCRKEQIYALGKYQDEILMAIFKRDWPAAGVGK